MKTLVQRIISAIVVLGLLWLVYYFYQAVGLTVLANLIILLGIREFSKFLNLEKGLSIKVSLLLYIASALTLLVYNLHINYKLIHVAGLLGALNFALIIVLRKQKDVAVILRTITYSFIGLIVYVCFPANVILILKNADGVKHFLNLLMLVFFGDICAYFVGKYVGGPKLAPSISPKKTISGSVGSLLGTFVAGLLMVYYQAFHFSPAFVGVLILISMVAQSGDLFESAFKRVAQVKDSGGIMPGHGGVLDRLDALYFAAPVYVLFLIYFNK